VLKTYVAATTQLAILKNRLMQDEKGAALIEYSILIGLITVAAIAAILFVGGWVKNAWSDLQAKLP